MAALANRDAARFRRLILTTDELRSLGLGPAKSRQVSEKIDGLEGKLLGEPSARQKEVDPIRSGRSSVAAGQGDRPGGNQQLDQGRPRLRECGGGDPDGETSTVKCRSAR